MSITSRRKKEFSRYVLDGLNAKIGFVDIGSGGELKHPWNLISSQNITKIDFDAEELRGEKLPLCISNQKGERPFHIACDPRASSLHEISHPFVSRFNQQSLLPQKTITVKCTTLDQYLANSFDEVDLLDINTEGHDYQVLLGAEQLFSEGFVKCVKN